MASPAIAGPMPTANPIPPIPKPPDLAVLHHNSSAAPSSHLNSAAAPSRSFASMVVRPKPKSRLPDVPLPARQYGVKDGVPSVAFSPAEHQALTQRLRYTLIAKFQIGRPSLLIIKDFIKSHWRIKGGFSMSAKWDDRHVVFILDSEEDVTEALTCPFRKIQHSNFRLFRWSVGYNPKKESSMVTKWIRLPELPMEYFTRSGVKAIVSSFANFLDIDDRTYEMNALQAARACVELDVTKPIPSKIWVHVGDEGFFQDIVVEGGIAYCMRCKLHGHYASTCKKAAKAANRAASSKVPLNEKTGNTEAKAGEWQVVKRGKGIRSVNVSSTPLLQMQNSLDGYQDSDIVIPGVTNMSHAEVAVETITLPIAHRAQNQGESSSEETNKNHMEALKGSAAPLTDQPTPCQEEDLTEAASLIAENNDQGVNREVNEVVITEAITTDVSTQFESTPVKSTLVISNVSDNESVRRTPSKVHFGPVEVFEYDTEEDQDLPILRRSQRARYKPHRHSDYNS